MISDKKLVEAFVKHCGFSCREAAIRCLGIKETEDVEVFVKGASSFKIEVTKEEREFLWRLCKASAGPSGRASEWTLSYRDVEESCP